MGVVHPYVDNRNITVLGTNHSDSDHLPTCQLIYCASASACIHCALCKCLHMGGYAYATKVHYLDSQGFLLQQSPLDCWFFSCKLLQNVFCNCSIFPCCLCCGTFPVQMLVVYSSHLAFAWALNEGGPRRLWYLGNISTPQRNPISGTPDMVISMSKFKTVQISKEIRTFESSML